MERDTSGFVIESNEPQPVETEAEAVTQEAEEQQEEAKEEVKETETAPEPKQPKNRAQKRIEALIKEKHDLQRKLDEAKNYRPPAEAAEDLDPDDFDDYDDYLDAVEKQTQKPSKKEAKQEANPFAETLEQLEAKFDDTREKYSDFDLKVRGMPILTESMLSAINESDDAGDVAYYLANNPEEAAKMSAMSPTKMALYVGRLEVKLNEPTKKEVAIPKKTTKAPEPIEPVGGANGQHRSLEDVTNYSEYEAMRKAEQSKKTGWV